MTPIEEPPVPFDVPDACTLPTAARPLRLAEFADLFATATGAVERVDATHARLHLAGPPTLAATVRDLTAREAACCSFFSFTVAAEPAAGGTVVTVDVRVPPRYADVLASLVDGAARAVPVDR